METPFLSFVHADDQAATISEAAALSRGEKTISFENRYRAKDGSYHWLLWTSAPDPLGHWIYASALDVTARKQTESDLLARTEELARSNNELLMFTSHASHDLQEPLRKIRVFADRLNTHLGTTLDETGRQYLERMTKSATRMSALINDILDYARVKNQPPKPTRTNLRVVLREVLDDLETTIEESAGEVKVWDLPTLSVDPLQMRQLFQNLISNALKFARSGHPPRVLISSGQRRRCRPGYETITASPSYRTIGYISHAADDR